MSKGDKASGMKSAYELALERLEASGIERPREGGLEEEVRERIAEERSKAEAKLAELDILHAKVAAGMADPAERAKAEEEHRLDRQRIEERRDARIRKIREEG